MELAGVASKIPEAQWQNEIVNCVRKEEAVGEKVEYKVRHHDHIIYEDEVGNNIFQKDNGMEVGQRYLAASGTWPRKGCSSSNAHWTTLGFTATTGEPVLCAIIFPSKMLAAEERLGIDLFAPVPTNYNVFSKEF